MAKWVRSIFPSILVMAEPFRLQNPDSLLISVPDILQNSLVLLRGLLHFLLVHFPSTI